MGTTKQCRENRSYGQGEVIKGKRDASKKHYNDVKEHLMSLYQDKLNTLGQMTSPTVSDETFVSSSQESFAFGSEWTFLVLASNVVSSMFLAKLYMDHRSMDAFKTG